MQVILLHCASLQPSCVSLQLGTPEGLSLTSQSCCAVAVLVVWYASGMGYCMRVLVHGCMGLIVGCMGSVKVYTNPSCPAVAVLVL